MNVFLFVVNYMADDHLIRFIRSVAAAQTVCPSVKVDLHVCDNSLKQAQEILKLRSRINESGMSVTLHTPTSNDGYFGVLRLAQSLVSKSTDCIIYCNSDLMLDDDFFFVLERILGNTGGVVAPAIISLKYGFDQNPKYRQRLSEDKLRRLLWIYAHRLTFLVYVGLGWVKELFLSWGRRPLLEIESSPIYAAHGSVLIFTDVNFFINLPEFPCFLFGEELFVAEEARLAGLSIIYEPSLRVRDVRHASICQLPHEFRRLLLLKSVIFILNQYYTEHRAVAT